MIFNQSSFGDVLKFLYITDTLYPNVNDGRFGQVTKLLWPAATNYAVYPKAWPVPPWGYIDFGDTVLIVLTGVTSVGDASSFYVSTTLPLAQAGSMLVSSHLAVAGQRLAAWLLGLFPAGTRSYQLFGHSYGGALALVTAGLLSAMAPTSSVSVATTGSPRPGDSSVDAALGRVNVRRWMNDDDPVPRFVPHASEAPAATIAAGFLIAFLWSQYTQPRGGVTVTAAGNFFRSDVPTSLLPITDLQLLAWAVGSKGFFRASHAVQTYIARFAPLAAKQAALVGQPSSGEPERPLALQQFNAGLSSPAFSPVAQGATMLSSVYVPPTYRAKAQATSGTPKLWNVYWMSGLQIAAGLSRSNAKSIAKSLNKFLRVLQTSNGVTQANFHSALTNYLGVASSPSSGFMPVLPVS